MTRPPRGELERAGAQDDHPDRGRYGARQRRLLHLDRRQRYAERKGGHSDHGPDEEVSHSYERGQPAEARLAGPANGLAVAPQHRDQGRQHHRHHHHDPLVVTGALGCRPPSVERTGRPSAIAHAHSLFRSATPFVFVGAGGLLVHAGRGLRLANFVAPSTC